MNTKVIFMCGTGGVGKTTTSVAMAMREARMGKRCVLLTIDPAKRLADALHLQMDSADPIPIDLPAESKGQLSALMLDAGATFEEISRSSTPIDKWPTLKENRYFQFAKERMGGIQEMMAVIKMMDLVSTGQYDTIVVDTPPAQNAQQFFDAPEKLTHLFSQSGLQWLTSKSSGFGSLNVAKSILSKGLNFFLGGETITEIGDFFGLFKQTAIVLEQRAAECQKLLVDPQTEYWMVEVPNRRLHQLDALKEALQEKNIHITGRLLNKTPIHLPTIQTDTIDAESLAILTDLQRHHAPLEPDVRKQYALKLPVSDPKNLESIQGLWQWSLAF